MILPIAIVFPSRPQPIFLSFDFSFLGHTSFRLSGISKGTAFCTGMFPPPGDGVVRGLIHYRGPSRLTPPALRLASSLKFFSLFGKISHFFRRFLTRISNSYLDRICICLDGVRKEAPRLRMRLLHFKQADWKRQLFNHLVVEIAEIYGLYSSAPTGRTDGESSSMASTE